MKKKYKKLLYPIFLSVLMVITSVKAESQGSVQRNQTVKERPTKIVSMPFIIPSPGAPGKRKVGAARRPNCPWVGDYLTALVPGTNVGLTTSQHPTFWFDIPYGSCGLSVEFRLSDNQDTSIYQQIFAVQGTPGLVSIRLPEKNPGLKFNIPYRWRFTIILDPGAPFDDARGPVVEGSVLRVALTPQLRQSLASANPRDRLMLYGQNGLWFDLLSGLREQYRTMPKDRMTAQDWRDVLQTVGLNHIASKPITACCSSPLSK